MNNLIISATGELVSNSVDPITDIPDGMEVVVTADNVGVWNPATRVYDPYPAVRVISVNEFILRFTDDEKDDLVTAAQTITRANTFLKILPMLGVVDLDSDFIQTSTQGMVSAGVLTSARRLEILADG